tara:strand:+ start:2055 stop:2270 length:216 start_codon:yes stop_codon:yes gene_type:complete
MIFKMKITKTQLRKIIKEELLKEAFQGAQGISDEGLEKAIMMVRDIRDIVDPQSEAGVLLVRLGEFLERGY